mmetsp:Transcript_5104/g.7325  ORF Transcript_5104/g.7325 Transcript_5104/m.7325 type:complete len:286 (-) Transcript_5104:541-1398(-)
MASSCACKSLALSSACLFCFSASCCNFSSALSSCFCNSPSAPVARFSSPPSPSESDSSVALCISSSRLVKSAFNSARPSSLCFFSAASRVSKSANLSSLCFFSVANCLSKSANLSSVPFVRASACAAKSASALIARASSACRAFSCSLNSASKRFRISSAAEFVCAWPSSNDFLRAASASLARPSSLCSCSVTVFSSDTWLCSPAPKSSTLSLNICLSPAASSALPSSFASSPAKTSSLAHRAASASAAISSRAFSRAAVAALRSTSQRASRFSSARRLVAIDCS